MAAPLDPTVPSNSDSPALGDDEIRALKQFLIDAFGFPVSPSALSTPLISVAPDGTVTFLKGPILANTGTPATTGQLTYDVNALKVNNGVQVGSVPLIIDKDSTLVIVQNTIANTQLYAKTLGPNLLGTAGRLRFTAIGTISILNGLNTATFSFNFAGAQIVTSQTLTGGSTTPRNDLSWRWAIELYMNGATNSWRAVSHMILTAVELPGGSDHPGFAGVSNGPTIDLNTSLNGFLDLAVSRIFQLSVSWNNPSPNNKVQYLQSFMELIL